MPTSPSSLVEKSLDPPVRGVLHSPDPPNGHGLILTHGAGSNCQAPLLISLAEAFCASGFLVLRCDLPYRQVRSFGPPGPGDAARDRAGLKNAVALIRSRVSGRVYLGGHSYGGRQSSMLGAEEPDLVSGLLLLSYPLHPPRRPSQLRTGHFPDLRTPTLFVSGTRDPFGTVEEMTQALKLIQAKALLATIEGAGHDLGFKGKTSKEDLPRRIVEEFGNFFS